MSRSSGIKIINCEGALVEDNEINGYQDAITAIDSPCSIFRRNKVFIEGYTDKLQDILEKIDGIKIIDEKEAALKKGIEESLVFAINFPDRREDVATKIKDSIGFIADWLTINSALVTILPPIIGVLSGINI